MILVTGATGFIGSHLIERLILKEKNKKIVCFVRKNEKNKEQVRFLEEKGCKIFYGDLLDEKSLEKALKGIKKVFHLAAIARPMNIPKPVYFEVNVKGTKNLLEACKKNKIKKIIFVSSMSIFGYSRDNKPLIENSPKIPVSDYGESKKQGENLAHEFCKKNKIKIVFIRPPMVFGPKDYQFLKLFKGIKTGFFPLLKKGQAKFEFCYVENLVEGILLADKNGKNLEAYNISDGKTYTTGEVFNKIAELENSKLIKMPVGLFKFSGYILEKIYSLFGKRSPFNSGTAEWMTNDNVMDISKAKRDLKYKQIIPLEESLKRTIKWYKKERLL